MRVKDLLDVLHYDTTVDLTVFGETPDENEYYIFTVDEYRHGKAIVPTCWLSSEVEWAYPSDKGNMYISTWYVF